MLRPDIVQNQTDGPRNLAVENFITEGEMSKDVPMPAFYDSEILKEEEQNHGFETSFSSASVLPVLSPVLWPSTSAFPVLSSSPSALPVLWPSSSALPVLSPSPSALPVLSPSASPGPAIESLLQPWSVESVAEESCYFPSFDPLVDSWNQDCKSNSSAFLSTTIINNTSLVFRTSLAGSPIGRSFSSCSHGLRNDENDRVVNLPPHSQQDPTLLYGRDEVERTADWYKCGVCWKRFRRKPDCTRHVKFTCGTKPFCCIVCKTNLCRKDSLVRHLKRKTGPCSKVLEAAQISNNAVATGRASRKDLGTDREIEAAIRRIGPLS